MNRCIFLGNLTRDPELRVTPTGKAVAQFAIAINRRIAADREETLFMDCEAWEKRAEAIAKYFAKGRPILVEGSLRQDHWEDKQTGAKRSKVKLAVDNFHFVGGKNGADGREPNAESPRAALPPGVPPPSPSGYGATSAPQINDDDIPF